MNPACLLRREGDSFTSIAFQMTLDMVDACSAAVQDDFNNEDLTWRRAYRACSESEFKKHMVDFSLLAWIGDNDTFPDECAWLRSASTYAHQLGASKVGELLFDAWWDC